MPQYSWPIGVGLGDRVDAAVGPQVGPAHAGGREPDDGVGRLDNLRVGALLEAHVARTVHDCSSHDGSPPYESHVRGRVFNDTSCAARRARQRDSNTHACVSLHCQRGRQVAIGVDLLLQILHLLLGDGNGIGAGDKAARRGLLAGNREECLRELGRVAGLLAVHGLVPLHAVRMTVCVVRNGRRRIGRRILGEQLGAEEPRVDNGGMDAERRDLRSKRLHPALQAELGGGVGGIELKAGEARA